MECDNLVCGTCSPHTRSKDASGAVVKHSGKIIEAPTLEVSDGGYRVAVGPVSRVLVGMTGGAGFRLGKASVPLAGGSIVFRMTIYAVDLSIVFQHSCGIAGSRTCFKGGLETL